MRSINKIPRKTIFRSYLKFLVYYIFFEEFSPLLIKLAPVACRNWATYREPFGDRNTG